MVEKEDAELDVVELLVASPPEKRRSTAADEERLVTDAADGRKLRRRTAVATAPLENSMTTLLVTT